MNNRKKGRIELETPMKLALSIPTILLLIWLGFTVHDWLSDSPSEESIDNILTLQAEIADFIPEVNERGESEMRLPYSIQKEFALVAFNEDDKNLPKKCRRKTCLCLQGVDTEVIADCPARFDDIIFEKTNTPLVFTDEELNNPNFFMITIQGKKTDKTIINILS